MWIRSLLTRIQDKSPTTPQLSQNRSPSSRASTTAHSTSSSRRLRSRKMAPTTPRSGIYERLENGMGPSRGGGGGKKFAWKKFAIGAAVLIGLVWFLGPREPRRFTWGTNRPATTGTPRPHHDNVDLEPLPPIPPVHTGRPGDDKTTINAPPTSPATDPDPLKTVHCSSPLNPSSRLVQYALMIDAGSTGSRIHIYKFNNCGPSAMYEYEVFKMTQPGLSSYPGRPVEAAESLDVLLDEAVRVVPESLRGCTPVAVKATAGLRLLGASQSADILAAIRQRLQDKYPFPIKEEDGVVIMDGKDEGVYAWITANYLLNTIRADTPAGTSSYAVLDLGGASTQIVFEPTFTKPDSSLADGDHKYDLIFGAKTHVLYQHSYLGYGLMRARKSVHRLVDFMYTLRPSTKGDVVGNPCLAKGTQRLVEIEDERTHYKRNVTMAGEDVGGFEACNRVMQLVMAKDAICELKPCSFDGVYQPSLLDTFPSGRILLLSYFYDRLNPLLSRTDSTRITVSSFASVAQDVCLGPPAWSKRWGDNKAVMEELEGRPEWCLDLTFMHALLRLGYEFADSREVKLGKQIQGTELGWCLGATIAMVGGDLKCRI